MLYKNRLARRFASHDRVDHSEKEYARYEEGRPTIHTNTVEGYFSVFKRGMRGTYQHCKEKHLHRYLAEFDFRYNNRSALGVEDKERATKAIVGAKGKRLREPEIDPGAPPPRPIAADTGWASGRPRFPMAEVIAQNYQEFGYRFVPLVREEYIALLLT